MEWIIGIVVGLALGGITGGVACWVVQEFRAKSRMASQPAEHQSTIVNLKAEHDKTVAELQAGHREEVFGLNARITDLNRPTGAVAVRTSGNCRQIEGRE